MTLVRKLGIDSNNPPPQHLRQHDTPQQDIRFASQVSFGSNKFETDIVDDISPCSRLALSYYRSIASNPPLSPGASTVYLAPKSLCLLLSEKLRTLLRLDTEHRRLLDMHMSQSHQDLIRAPLRRRWVLVCGGQITLRLTMGTRDLIPFSLRLAKMRLRAPKYLAARWKHLRR